MPMIYCQAVDNYTQESIIECLIIHLDNIILPIYLSMEDKYEVLR